MKLATLSIVGDRRFQSSDPITQQRHKMHAHGSTRQILGKVMKKSIKCTVCGKRLPRRKIYAHFLCIHDPSYTVLGFKKRLVESNSETCDRCGNQFEPLWKYEENKQNIAYLCEQCVKQIRQEISKKERDILDSGKVFVNSFESNRHKY